MQDRLHRARQFRLPRPAIGWRDCSRSADIHYPERAEPARNIQSPWLEILLRPTWLPWRNRPPSTAWQRSEGSRGKKYACASLRPCDGYPPRSQKTRLVTGGETAYWRPSVAFLLKASRASAMKNQFSASRIHSVCCAGSKARLASSKHCRPFWRHSSAVIIACRHTKRPE